MDPHCCAGNWERAEVAWSYSKSDEFSFGLCLLHDWADDMAVAAAPPLATASAVVEEVGKAWRRKRSLNNWSSFTPCNEISGLEKLVWILGKRLFCRHEIPAVAREFQDGKDNLFWDMCWNSPGAAVTVCQHTIPHTQGERGRHCHCHVKLISLKCHWSVANQFSGGRLKVRAFVS